MPLHDWADDRGWDSMHQLWINALLFWVQDRLPSGYRAYLGSVPGLTLAAEPVRPDFGVRSWAEQKEAQVPDDCAALTSAIAALTNESDTASANKRIAATFPRTPVNKAGVLT